MYADQGYDFDKYRRLPWKRGIRPMIARRGIAHGSGLGKVRWVVERSFAWLHHPGSLPRTPAPPPPPPEAGEEALDEERLLLATATAHPDNLKTMRWLQPEDFALPLHGRRCLTALAHRGAAIDPVTVLWEAQHRQLLTADIAPAELMARVSKPVGSPECRSSPRVR